MIRSIRRSRGNSSCLSSSSSSRSADPTSAVGEIVPDDRDHMNNELAHEFEVLTTGMSIDMPTDETVRYVEDPLGVSSRRTTDKLHDLA